MKKRKATAAETFEVPTRIEFAGASEDEMVFSGLAFAFGYPVDTWPSPTVIARGAFSKTLAEQGERVRILWQHDQHDPIGAPIAMAEESDGFRIKFRLDPVPNGVRAATQLRSGTLEGLSIGFDPIKWEMVPEKEWTKLALSDAGREKLARDEYHGPIRLISEIRLWEVSVVTAAAQRVARVQMAANTFRDLPVIRAEWDAERAGERVREWAGESQEKRSRAFLVTNGEGFEYPIADVVDGRLVAVADAVFAAALTVERIEDEDVRERVKGAIDEYYAKLEAETPWARAVTPERIALEAKASGAVKDEPEPEKTDDDGDAKAVGLSRAIAAEAAVKAALAEMELGRREAGRSREPDPAEPPHGGTHRGRTRRGPTRR